MSAQPPSGPDRFAAVAAGYDRWIGWGPRLARELPFLLASLPAPQAAPGAGILDVGCGTGAHAIALAAAGHAVTGLDLSGAMLAQARQAEDRARAEGRLAPAAALRWVQGDVTAPGALPGESFGGVLAIGNSLLACGDDEAVMRGLRAAVALVAPGGTLVLQYLNGERIRRQGRLVVKAEEDLAGGESARVWLRHHFEAGGRLHFHSYVLSRAGGGWQAEVRSEPLVDLAPARVVAEIGAAFEEVRLLDGLSEREFSPESSDAVGIRACGRRG